LLRRLRRIFSPNGLFFLSTPLGPPCAFAGRRIFVVKEIPMPIGTVKFFNADKGYGFIAPEDGTADSFVHISAVERAGLSTLNKDQRVSYEVEVGQRGKASAVNLALA